MQEICSAPGVGKSCRLEEKKKVRKHFVVGWVILTLAFLAPAALAQGEGQIEAQVVNGTANGGPVESLAVTLRAFRDGTDELEPQTAVADAKGRVNFEGLDTSPDIVYVLSATYVDIEYNTLPLSFTESNETTLTPILEVYEATENPEQAVIQVERMHVFVDFTDETMSVGELHIFTNTGDRTFIGVEDDALGQRVTLRFVLPDGAQDLRFQMGGEGDRYLVTQDGFADTEAVRPGASQQVLYSYTLSYGEADTFDFVRPLTYPIANVNVLVPRLGMNVTSDRIELNEIRTVEGQAYLNLNGRDFAPGDELSVHFEGLQEIARQLEMPGETQQGFDPKWIALGLAALALVGGLLYPSLRASGKPMPPSQQAEPTNERLTRLLQAIAHLDDAFETGSIDEANYRKQRQAIKSETLKLMRES